MARDGYPTFSIITPSFNQGTFLRDTIESVLSQQGDFAIEYIVMDGCSTDNSLDILRTFETMISDGRYRPRCKAVSYRWFSEKDKGQADAINKGLKIASGDIVAFLNSDDLYERGALKRAAELFAEHAEVEVVYGNAFYIDDAGAITGLYATKDIHDYPLNLYCFICQPTVFMRRSVPERIGLFNDRIRNSFDYEYWLRAHHAGMKFLYTRDVLASCRLHSQTKTSMNRQDIYIECIAILRHFNEEVHPNWLLGFTMELSPPGTLLGGLNKRMTTMATKFFDRYQRNFVGSHERNIREMEKRMFG